MRVLLAASLIAIAAPSAAATYMPVGPQTNVALSTVTGGGWTLCYSALMGTPFGNSASTTLANCGRSGRIMLAGRETGSSNLLVLAQTAMSAAFANTGAANNGVFTASNGADWFYADDWSWGFKPIGVGFNKYQCDFNAMVGSMCVHTLNFTGGFSINNIIDLNGSSDYEKLVFTMAVPEPATWAMLIAGFGLVGATLRRRKALPA